MQRLNKLKVLIVARDAGPANALGPVARTLIQAGCVRVSLAGYRYAESAFQHHDLPLLGVEDDDQPDAADRLLDREQPSFLLTGTSMKVIRDNALWKGARARGIPSLAVLDHWGNYWQRFTENGQARFGCLPDRIAVMDESVHQAMVNAGCPPEKLVVTGQP